MSTKLENLDLRKGWKISTVEEGVEKIIDYRGKTPQKTSSGIPLITAKIIKNGRIGKPQEFIDPAEYRKCMSRGLPKKGDVILTTEAPLGEVAQIKDENVALAQRVILLRGKDGDLDNTFLLYLLQSPFVQNELRKRETGTTVTGIKQSELRKVLLPLPPLNEQRKIAQTLFDLDAKIELNLKMNETLEQMLFTLWRKLISENSNVLIEISELIEFNPKVQIKVGQESIFVEMKDLSNTGMTISNFILRRFNSGSRFENGDTLLARITPCLENGKTAFVNFIPDGYKGFGSTEFIVMRAKDFVSPHYVYCVARDEKFRTHAIKNMSGTSGRQRVNIDSLKTFQINKIDIEQMAKFNGVSKPLVDKINKNTEESRILYQMRNLLLPQLLNGKMRVH